MMRTYAGHSSATDSNALYRTNLAKGQTGLSVAFDLPTQTGYDPDPPLARGEVGKVGVPIPHLGEMRRLFDDIPLDRDEHLDDDQRHRDVAARALPGGRRGAGGSTPTPPRSSRTCTAARRHHPERHHQGVPLPRHLRVPARALAAADQRPDRLHRQPHPEVEPDQHLQLPPAGGRRDARRRSSPTRCAPRSRCSTRSATPARSTPEDFAKVVGRISFFVNAGVRFVEEMCKMRAFVRLWDEITRERYGVEDEKMRRFRYGVQVNSPGPDRGAAGEQRAADRARDARRHAVQGRPRPRRTAAGVERGARPAPALGPAVVAAAAAGAGLRVRPAGVRRPVRGLEGRRGQGRASWSPAPAPRWTGCRRWAARSRPSSPAT